MYLLYDQTKYDTPGLSIPDTNFADLAELCRDLKDRTISPDQKGFTGWVCFAKLHADATSRTIHDVADVTNAIGLDLDHVNWSRAELLTRLGKLRFIAFSTTSSTALARRWRVFLELSREMTPNEYMGVWKALNLLLNGEVDASTKNVNRLHYLPANWIGGNNEFYEQDGVILDVDQLLTISPPEPAVFYDVIERTDGLRAPEGNAIVTQAMITKHMIGQGGGRFFKLLCAAATYYKANGWTLTASDLANAALVVSPMDSHGMRRAMSAYREAERALGYIDKRVATVAPKDRLLNNLRYRYSEQARA